MHATLTPLPHIFRENYTIAVLTGDMIYQAGNFLVNIIKAAQSKIKTFNEFRTLLFFDYKSQTDVTILPCTSSAVQLHIIRGFYQRYQ